jgi:hypothetical protein
MSSIEVGRAAKGRADATAEAQLWVTWTALTGEALPPDASALVAAHPEVAAAAEPDLGLRASAVETDREGRPTALLATVERPFERWHLVALLNWREGAALCALPLERAGLTPGEEWLVYDFWGRASLGIASHAVGRRLPPRSCLLVSLRANLKRPQVVGSAGHLSVGGQELLGVAWDDAAGTLSGAAAPGDEPLDLMVRSPHPFVPVKATGGEVGSVAEARVALTLPPGSGPRRWSIQFGEAPPPGRVPLRLVDFG